MYTTHLVDHVALGMPTFVSGIPVDLHKLLENSAIATSTFSGKSSGIVKVTVDVVVVFVVGVLWTKEC